MASSSYELEIKPRKGWQPVDLREVWKYRELFGILIWRDIKIRYKQTALGGLWAILQPLVAMIIFGGLFNRVAHIPSDGIPYPLFVYAALVPWTFFQNAVSLSSNSLVGSEQMIRKIYFPRVLMPMGMIGALGLDMVVSLAFMGVLIYYYHWHVSLALIWLPLFALGTFLVAAGLGLFLAAVNVQYRDVKYVVPFFTQMFFFLTPVLYPLHHMQGKLKTLLMLNPMSGMVEGFRHALIGSPISGWLVGGSFAGSMVMFLIGLYFFRRVERTFADVI
jgi:homopolymeric O-antigen transport system permease protein